MSDPAEIVRAALVDSLATVPTDVLIEALVRRGALTSEWDGAKGRYDRRYVTAWEAADD